MRPGSLPAAEGLQFQVMPQLRALWEGRAPSRPAVVAGRRPRRSVALQFSTPSAHVTEALPFAAFCSWPFLFGADIIPTMAALAKTNRYIRDPETRLRSVVEGARQSSILEGARGLPTVGDMCKAIKRSSMAKAKRSAKSL